MAWRRLLTAAMAPRPQDDHGQVWIASIDIDDQEGEEEPRTAAVIRLADPGDDGAQWIKKYVERND